MPVADGQLEWTLCAQCGIRLLDTTGWSTLASESGVSDIEGEASE